MFDVMSVTAADVSGLISVPAPNFSCNKGHTNIRRLTDQRQRNGWYLVQRQCQHSAVMKFDLPEPIASITRVLVSG